jgi:arsenate reductase-like glutaredoxin family protein
VLVRQHRKLWVKVGEAMQQWDRDQSDITDEEIFRFLIHRDGRLRVPVLSRGPVLIRGFTPGLYRQILLPETDE